MLRKVFIFLVLSLGTFLAYYTVDRYTEIGDQLLANHDFSDGLQGWQVGGSTLAVTVCPGQVRLESSEPQASVLLSQRLNSALLGERVVLKGQIKTIGIEGGKKGWEKGRVVLVQYVDGRAVYKTPHMLVALDGTHDWGGYKITLPILRGASEARVELQLNRCVGALQVKDLALFQVVESPLYRLVRWLVIGSWGLFTVFILGPGLLATCGAGKQRVFVMLVFVAIIVGTTVPGAVKNEAKYEILSEAQAYSKQIVAYGGSWLGKVAGELEAVRWLRVDITKVAHFLLFGLLGGLLYIRKGRGAVWRVVVDAGMLACGTELVQLFVEDRSALVGDVVIDMVGVGFGVLVVGWRLRGGGGCPPARV